MVYLLLWRHCVSIRRCRIWVEHLLLWLSVCGWVRLLDLLLIHAWISHLRVSHAVFRHHRRWWMHASLLSDSTSRHRRRRLLSSTSLSTASSAGRRFLSRDNVDEEVEHVRFCQRGRDVRPLKRPSLVLFGVDPRTHCELGYEDVAAFCKEDGSFGRYHFDFRVGFHDFFDARQRQLVELEVVLVRLQLGYLILPIHVKDVLWLTGQALRYLGKVSQRMRLLSRDPTEPTFAHGPVKTCASGACPMTAIWTEYQYPRSEGRCDQLILAERGRTF